MAGDRSRVSLSPARISLQAVMARHSRPSTVQEEISAFGEQACSANLENFN